MAVIGGQRLGEVEVKNQKQKMELGEDSGEHADKGLAMQKSKIESREWSLAAVVGGQSMR